MERRSATPRAGSGPRRARPSLLTSSLSLHCSSSPSPRFPAATFPNLCSPRDDPQPLSTSERPRLASSYSGTMDRAVGRKQDLEEALLRIMHEHHHQSLYQSSIFSCEERGKKDALRSTARFADLLVDTVGGDVQEREAH
ncbi:hypothetical protein U9M48_019839 [Paspalum notatum var. saurae]|uniref:Uncharacterized protein n=1 Tax=Paspalum notatum var. saurae TaxID=547442 RepID=A0AAQ3TFP6_PASNO